MSGNHKRMKDSILFTTRIAIGFLVVVSAGYFVGADRLIEMFMENDAIIAYGTRLQAVAS